jgi:hypothetical protein
VIKYICTVIQFAPILSITMPKAPLNARPAPKAASSALVELRRTVLLAHTATILLRLGNVKSMTTPKTSWNVCRKVRNGMIIGMAASVYLKIASILPIISQESGAFKFQLSNAMSDFINQMKVRVKNAKLSPPTTKKEPAPSAGKFQASSIVFLVERAIS